MELWDRMWRAARADWSPTPEVDDILLVNKLSVITLPCSMTFNIFAFNLVPILEVLERYFKTVFLLKVRVLRNTWLWISMSLYLFSQPRHHIEIPNWLFSCRFNFRHMFCIWAIVKNDPTLGNHSGNSDNSEATNFKDHRPLQMFILLTDITAK